MQAFQAKQLCKENSNKTKASSIYIIILSLLLIHGHLPPFLRLFLSIKHTFYITSSV